MSKANQNQHSSEKIRKTRVASIDAEIGLKLQQFRKKFNITQTELGDAIGVTFQQIQKYEKGVNRIHAEVLWRIAYIFGIDVEFFFPDTDNENKMHLNINSVPYDDKQSLNLVKSYLEIKDKNVRKKIQNLVSSIIDSEKDEN